jgi:hypothetical protein
MMDNIHILYASWCNTKGSDKVWGYFYAGDGAITPSFVWDKPVFVFWGARGKALQLKEHLMSDDLVTLKRSKQRKGYDQIPDVDFHNLCPNFYKEVEDKLTFAILAGNKYKLAV